MKNLIKGVVIASVIFTSCKEKEDDKTDLGALKSATKVTYANIAFANYSDAHSEAKELKIAIDAFVANPSESTQNHRSLVAGLVEQLRGWRCCSGMAAEPHG